MRADRVAAGIAVMAMAFGDQSVVSADNVGLPVAKEDSQVSLDGRAFQVSTVDPLTAARETAAIKALIARDGEATALPHFPDLRDCRVVRTREHGKSAAPIFYLGICNKISQIDFCHNTKTGYYSVSEDQIPTTAADLIRVMRACVLQTYCNGDCE